MKSCVRAAVPSLNDFGFEEFRVGRVSGLKSFGLKGFGFKGLVILKFSYLRSYLSFLDLEFGSVNLTRPEICL